MSFANFVFYPLVIGTIIAVIIEQIFRATGDEDQRILLGQEVGLGFTLGVTSGFALKKAARTILFTVRSLSISLRFLP